MGVLRRYQRLLPCRAALDESGIALIMALAVMLVLTVMVTSTLAYTSSNARDASRSRAGQSAYALAEGGINVAVATLESHYYSSATATPATANNNTSVYSSSWFSGTSSQQSPSSTAACTSTSTCMSWGVASWTPSGSSSITKGTLVLQGQGRVPNPTGARP